MKKLQDFAKECGVTDRQIQRLLKKYESEVVGHFERKGPNGTWLDQVACSVLRSKMKIKELAVLDENEFKLRQENDQLRKERDQMQDELFGAKQMILQMKEKQLQIEEKSSAETVRADVAEADAQEKSQQLQEANAEIEALKKELEIERNKGVFDKLKEKFRRK